ncbi:ABC transporter permease subunit [Cohnella caldifontis]|uniref:ABC transporter permease subunit n=1 Tax=Cohnella caldifontis TaxID=3027471 RepID=UPI0023EDAE8E|nr:ABC transporter permease subunit [Cohnella sp. YIM B05605]
MAQIYRIALITVGVVAFVLVLAMLPAVIQTAPHQGGLLLNWKGGFSSIRDYFEGLRSGEAFRYLSGRTELSFWEQICPSFKITLFYMGIGALTAMTLGILLGIYVAVSRKEWLKRVLEFTGILPDFLIILVLQFAVVFIYLHTKVLIFEVASTSSDDPAVALPLISAVIIPANYMIRNVALHMSHALADDYINFAKARGMGKRTIVFFHALPNVLPYVKADMHKFMGILFGNLFIVEYLYNLDGVAMLVFSNAYGFEGYQYSLAANGILTLLVLYAIGYAILKLFLYGWEKVLLR